MENNARIMTNIQNTLKMVREQLDAENEVPYKVKYTSDLLTDIAERLDLGAEKYGMQVPIEESDGRIFTREAYEEFCDAIVYLSSIGLNLISKAKDDDERYHAHMMGNILFNTCYQTIKYMELINDKETI
tara:strand:- start:1050 stop:1439 length:390 start_codon:yes stop_codon:yes gene_type:complete